MTKTKSGKHYRYRDIEFWAENGLINILDHRYPSDDHKHFTVVTVSYWLRNANDISDELKSPYWLKYPDERNEWISHLENVVASCQEAKAQGRPDDPKAVADILKQRSRTIYVGEGQRATLHTAPASETPEGKLLPPLPRPSQKKLIIP